MLPHPILVSVRRIHISDQNMAAQNGARKHGATPLRPPPRAWPSPRRATTGQSTGRDGARRRPSPSDASGAHTLHRAFGLLTSWDTRHSKLVRAIPCVWTYRDHFYRAWLENANLFRGSGPDESKRMASCRSLSPRRGTAALAKGDKLDWWRTCRSSVHIWKQPHACVNSDMPSPAAPWPAPAGAANRRARPLQKRPARSTAPVCD